VLQAPLRPHGRHLPVGGRDPLLLHQRAAAAAQPQIHRRARQLLRRAGAGAQVRHLPGRVGAGPGPAAVHQRDLRLHPGAPELHAVRPPGPGVPQVALEAGRLRPPALRPAQVPPGRREQVRRLRRRLAGQEPYAVSLLPLGQGALHYIAAYICYIATTALGSWRVGSSWLMHGHGHGMAVRVDFAGGEAQGRVGDGQGGPEHDPVLRGLQLHHVPLLVAVPGEVGGGRRRRVQAVLRRARQQVAVRRVPVRLRLRAALGGQLVHAPVLLLRGRPARRRRVRPAQLHQQPQQPALAPDGVPDGAAGARRRQVPGQGHPADAVADVALRGRGVRRRRGLPAHAAVQGRRDGADGRAGAGVLHVAAGGVQEGQGPGRCAHGPHRRDADAARRPPQPVRALAGREADALQRLHPLVPARAHRRME
jgi:hypothetical protein